MHATGLVLAVLSRILTLLFAKPKGLWRIFAPCMSLSQRASRAMTPTKPKLNRGRRPSNTLRNDAPGVLGLEQSVPAKLDSLSLKFLVASAYIVTLRAMHWLLSHFLKHWIFHRWL